MVGVSPFGAAKRTRLKIKPDSGIRELNGCIGVFIGSPISQSQLAVALWTVHELAIRPRCLCSHPSDSNRRLADYELRRIVCMRGEQGRALFPLLRLAQANSGFGEEKEE